MGSQYGAEWESGGEGGEVGGEVGEVADEWQEEKKSYECEDRKKKKYRPGRKKERKTKLTRSCPSARPLLRRVSIPTKHLQPYFA